MCAELDLGNAGQIEVVQPLTGGVASDIARVDIKGRSYCVKFALPKLRVEADWQVPVHRNRAEYEWLSFARSVAPASAPQLFGHSEKLHGFAMEFIYGDGKYLWKQAMLSGTSAGEEAGAVADVLAKIHLASMQPDFNRTAFENRDDFFSIRLEPYLIHTANCHAGIAGRLHDLAARFHASEIGLVHGDVSPKNIMIDRGVPILLDAECATMGDPAFDVAFCLNHLVIKALHLPASRERLLDAVTDFWASYVHHVEWEPPRQLESRVLEILPALMLGRVDGKSPVEYLDTSEQQNLRALSIPLILDPPTELDIFTSVLRKRMKPMS